jgi:hypothetical protein
VRGNRGTRRSQPLLLAESGRTLIFWPIFYTTMTAYYTKKKSNKQKLKNDSITTSFGCLFSFCLSCIVQSLSASPPAGDFLTAHTSHNRGTNNYIRPPVSSPPPIYQPINKTFSPPQQRRRLLLVVVAGRGHGCRICIYRAASIKTHNVKRHNRCIAIDPPNKPKPTTTHVHSAR